MTYDCFCYNGEEDILEMRLNILDKYVDRFVICEAMTTFQGNYKPLYYEENQEKFSRWKDKIIYHITPQYSSDTIPTAFDLAAFQKDSIRFALKGCQPDDIIIYGDVDEIPSIELLKKLKS